MNPIVASQLTVPIMTSIMQGIPPAVLAMRSLIRGYAGTSQCQKKNPAVAQRGSPLGVEC
jgi:hypothetical protein